MPRVCVLVVGDLGRSPRMNYHALSLLQSGFNVDLVGYAGSALLPELTESEQVKVHYIREFPSLLNKCPRIIAKVLKALWLTLTLLTILLFIPQPQWILLQNVPGVPSIPVCLVIRLIRRCRLVLDWHNYGFTILALNFGSGHRLVTLMRFIELNLGKFFDHHLCVSAALKKDLLERKGIKAHVLYDRPPERFKPLAIEERHRLFMDLAKEYEAFRSAGEERVECTRFTRKPRNGGSVEWRIDRPKLVISSTSWTEDDNFEMLVDALKLYSEAKKGENNSTWPDIVCAVTGKGPLRAQFERDITANPIEHVEFLLPWLEPEDYPRILASADLGVCLHDSSSGLDLPMKVVDMFGCALPVCALYYQCIRELVRDHENGLIFENASQLCAQLQQLLSNERSFLLEKMQQKLHMKARSPSNRWHHQWTQVVLPILNGLNGHEPDAKKDS